MSDKARDFMIAALRLARKAAEADEVPIGAVVVKDGVIIGRGYNRVEARNDVTQHAEIIAIRAAAKKIGDWRLSGCTLYTTLEPCPMCADAIQKARISNVIYAATDPKGGAWALGLGDLLLQNPRRNHRTTVRCSETHHDESAGILREFFSRKRRNKKNNRP